MDYSDRIDWKEVEKEAEELLIQLLQINTTNPPGNEQEAVEFLAEELRKDGIEPEVLVSAPGRGNLVARLKSQGEAPPFLLSSHVDVVAAEPEKWKYPPFSGAVAEGCIWGRGALDMKGMVAMEVTLFRLLKRLEFPLKRDVILAVVADEEAGGEYGMKWLVEKHREKIQAEYSFNEGGGFSLHGKKGVLYPIQVAHKGVLWLELTFLGTPGHGSAPREDNPVLSLLKHLPRVLKRSPLQFLPVTKEFLKALGKIQGTSVRILFSLLSLPWLGEKLLALLPKDRRPFFKVMLSNTVTPTGLSGSPKPNVIPAEAKVVLDCRTLPGTDHQKFLKELLSLLPKNSFRYKILEEETPYEMDEWKTPCFQAICQAIRKFDPNALVTPYLTIGFTDAKHLEKIGVKTYGFFPLPFPKDFDFSSLFHGHNERIPIDSFRKGLRILWEALQTMVRKE